MEESIINKINNIISQLNILKAEIASYSQKDESVSNSKESELETLKNLLFSEQWPDCVPSELICDINNEEQKKQRAKGIMDQLIGNIKNLKFLDAGCGEGHSAFYAPQLECDLSVGYDIVKSQSWNTLLAEDKTHKVILTSDFNDVKKNGKYDVILVYDVIDHIESETIVDFLLKIKEVLNQYGIIQLRTHPWISRHGSHLYRQLNKAFVHLIFSDEELKEITNDITLTTPTQKVTKPIITYENIIKQCGLKIADKNEIKEIVEPIFKNNKILANRIMKNTGFKQFPEFQMSLNYIDYILEKN